MIHRHLGREYVWTREDGFRVALGILRTVVPFGESQLLEFDTGPTILDDKRVTEVKRGFFGGRK